MQIAEIPYIQTSFLPKLVKDYLENKLPIEWGSTYPDWKDFEKKIEQRKSFTHRELLVQMINKQYHSFVLHKKVKHNIKSLQENTTFTITTGHQLCLFLGPLYVVYKILHCIKLANELNKKYKSYHFVPVFWMASEDHDTQEINHVFVKGEMIKWNVSESIPAGKLSTEGIEVAIEQLRKSLGLQQHSETIISLFKEAYSNYKNLAQATRYLINELLGSYGIVVIDGDEIEFKKILKPIFKKEINEQCIEKNVQKAIQHMLPHSYKIQANPRNCNIFWLHENQRIRIEKVEDKFYLSGTNQAFTKEEILNRIDETPEKFSPNVLMRPLYQETVLPNLVNVGGAAETAYWLELTEVFKELNIPFPLLFLRASVILTDEKIMQKIKKTELKVEDFFSEESGPERRYLQKNNLVFKTENPLLTAFLEELQQNIVHIDASLETSAKATAQKIKNELEQLEKKVQRAIKLKNEVQLEQIKKCKEKFFPQNKMQERTVNFSEYFVNTPHFIDCIYEAIDVSGKNIAVLKCL
ncbi:MAG: bacillithiol biosynthesis cysteine-adding enzyme BshC [Bacteroidetes bacterium]|nr:bacillithiol biosynthesis cysteine-adding enzyme BshC [Bacteroidota bacterium]MBV6460756.1 putative cysteine ligase BshC [Flavobacteriales bacterium]WKZ75752.1 MAG: bacillithiol biosynthesis cysteine-adding enzyme BshC [Vicingaceae bacterium]MCL4817310.1 bacillithiol biosynthesis cysteine-adding enzyme BshC [Flavobacteriales bacterium]NOG94728.1 bacillithiol biosynthesis cysteine-adding enzyme BshC [Bacteroidota bacterium]